MKPGFFKSATALVMIASLAAPLPGMAQNNANEQYKIVSL